MSALLAHVEAPALLPAPLLVLLAGAAVLAPARLLRGRDDPPEHHPASGLVAARPAVAGAVLLALLATAVLGVAVAPRPGPPLAWAWLGVTALSLALGQLWAVGNPLRLLVRLVDPEEAGGGTAPRRLATAAAAGGVLLLGWLQHAPLSSAVVAAALVAYLAAHLLAGLRWGSGWFARAEAVEVYSTLAADAVRSRTPGPREDDPAVAPGTTAGLVVLAAFAAVPLQARLVRQPLWFEVTGGLTARQADLVGTVLLVGVALVAFAAFRAVGRGRAGVPLAAAVVGLFASHQVALLTRPSLAIVADLAPTDPELVVATVLPLLVLLAGVVRASQLLSARTRDLSPRQAGAVRVPALVLIGALAVVATLLSAAPL